MALDWTLTVASANWGSRAGIRLALWEKHSLALLVSLIMALQPAEALFESGWRSDVCAGSPSGLPGVRAD